MDPSEFRRHGHALVEWIADYLTASERYPVLARVAPGEVRRALPERGADAGERFDEIFADFERILVPALTHWNHPGFFAYFPATTSASGILAEFLSAALNQQAMLWRTSPAATELQEVSVIDTAVLTLGLGRSSVRRIPFDEQQSMEPYALRTALEEDRQAGVRP